MDKVSDKVLEAAEKGVGLAMLQLHNDMLMEEPTAPLDEGFLRGSISAFVQNVRINLPKDVNAKTNNEVLSINEKLNKNVILGFIGVNVPYAARWHEVPARFKEESAGNKYLEIKLANNQDRYIKIIGNAIKKAK